MNLTNQVIATKENFMDFIKNYPANIPVVMINIMKFKTTTATGEAGKKAYMRYSKNVAPLLKGVGGRIIWSGIVNKTVIGDLADKPDMVAIVEYPSKQAFVNMATSPAYQAIKEDREISLEYGGLLASSTLIMLQ